MKNFKEWPVVLGLGVALVGFGCSADAIEAPADTPAEASSDAGTAAEEVAPKTDAEDAAEVTTEIATDPAEVAEEVIGEVTEEIVVAEATPQGSGDGSGVAGSVKFDGPRPKRKTIKMSADKGCVDAHGDKAVGTESELVSADGDVANVFVYVKDGASLGAAAPTETVSLVQNGCMYSPRIVGVQVGQTFNVENSDPFMHNVRGLAKKNRPFNFGQPNLGVRERIFKRVELPIKVRCDIHPWMAAFIFVTDHPYYTVTDRKGTFSIPNLPAGEHTLVAVHEEYGKKEVKVTVPASGAAQATFMFAPSDIKPAWM